MKLWAVLTVFLYFLVLVLFTVPLLILVYGDWWGPKGGGITLKDSISLYKEAGYWVWVGFMVISQAVMLFTPARSRERLPPRRPLLVPILIAGFLLANLILCAIVCVLCLCLSDKGVMVFAVIGEFVANDAAKMWGFIFGKAGMLFSTNVQFAFGIITATAAFWLFWALVFYWFAKSDDPDSLVQRSTRWILRGSIAELVVAVPTHIAVRHRQDCCAPVATLCGIATGLAVLLMAFGPGVYFLFRERARRLKPGKHAGVSEQIARS
jgi:hypothetical protein